MKNSVSGKDFVTVIEASRRLGLPRYRLDKMKQYGQLPGCMMGKTFFVNLPLLEEYLRGKNAD